jgi:hypothetical protein
MNIRVRDKGKKKPPVQLKVMGYVMGVNYRTYLTDNVELLNNVMPAITVCPLGRYISVEFPVNVIIYPQGKTGLLISCLQKCLSVGNIDTTAKYGISRLEGCCFIRDYDKNRKLGQFYPLIYFLCELGRDFSGGTYYCFVGTCAVRGRSQWPRGLRLIGTVFALSNAGIMGSNLTEGMDVCVRLFCFYVVPCVGSGLATG